MNLFLQYFEGREPGIRADGRGLRNTNNRIANSSQNGNNNNSTLNIIDSVNAKSVDNSENSHTRINKSDNYEAELGSNMLIFKIDINSPNRY